MKLFLIFATTVGLGAAGIPREAPPAFGAPAPCQFGKENPIQAQSTWYDQFACYQSSGRHVSVPGSGAFEAGTVSGGLCLIGVAHDRIQIAPCGSFSGTSALTIAYSAIAYVIDDPSSEPANIYVSALFHR